MKFTVLYRYNDDVKKYFEEKRGRGKLGFGINLVRLDTVSILKTETGELHSHAYAFRCKGSLLSYLYNKKLCGKHATHLIGWK